MLNRFLLVFVVVLMLMKVERKMEIIVVFWIGFFGNFEDMGLIVIVEKFFLIYRDELCDV